MIACAIPKRCFIPSEYFPTCFLEFGSNPTRLIASFTSSFDIFPAIFARYTKFDNPLSCHKNPGFSINAPKLSGKSTSFPIFFPRTIISPRLGYIYPQIILNKTDFPEPFRPTNP